MRVLGCFRRVFMRVIQGAQWYPKWGVDGSIWGTAFLGTDLDRRAHTRDLFRSFPANDARESP